MSTRFVDENHIWHSDALKAVVVLSSRRSLQVEEYDAVNLLRKYIKQNDLAMPDPTSIVMRPGDMKICL